MSAFITKYFHIRTQFNKYIPFSLNDKCLVIMLYITSTLIHTLFRRTGKDKTRVGVVVFSNDTEHIVQLGAIDSAEDFADVDLVPRPYRKVGTETHSGLELILTAFDDNGRDVSHV